MRAFPISPRLVKGGLVLVDPDSGTVQKIIVLQYNPDTLTRRLEWQSDGTVSGYRSDASPSHDAESFASGGYR